MYCKFNNKAEYIGEAHIYNVNGCLLNFVRFYVSGVKFIEINRFQLFFGGGGVLHFNITLNKLFVMP